MRRGALLEGGRRHLLHYSYRLGVAAALPSLGSISLSSSVMTMMLSNLGVWARRGILLRRLLNREVFQYVEGSEKPLA